MRRKRRLLFFNGRSYMYDLWVKLRLAWIKIIPLFAQDAGNLSNIVPLRSTTSSNCLGGFGISIEINRTEPDLG